MLSNAFRALPVDYDAQWFLDSFQDLIRSNVSAAPLMPWILIDSNEEYASRRIEDLDRRTNPAIQRRLSVKKVRGKGAQANGSKMAGGVFGAISNHGAFITAIS